MKKETKKPAPKKRSRSAETGKIVSEKFAKENPKTTVTEKVKKAVVKAPVKPKVKTVKPKVVKPKPLKAAEPKVYATGVMYRFNDMLATIDSLDPLKVTVHSVRNGCQTETPLEVASLDDYEISDISKAEAHGILSNAGNF